MHQKPAKIVDGMNAEFMSRQLYPGKPCQDGVVSGAAIYSEKAVQSCGAVHLEQLLRIFSPPHATQPHPVSNHTRQIQLAEIRHLWDHWSDFFRGNLASHRFFNNSRGNKQWQVVNIYTFPVPLIFLHQ